MHTETIIYDPTHGLHCTVFCPSRKTQNINILYVVHGGAWALGKKETFFSIASQLCESLDVHCVVPDYRLSDLDPSPLMPFVSYGISFVVCYELLVKRINPKYVSKVRVNIILIILVLISIALFVIQTIIRTREVKHAHPTHVNDLATCMEYTYDFICGSINQASIYMLGHSAGAHMCSLVALNPSYLKPTLFQRIRAVVGIAGAYSFWNMQDSFLKNFVDYGVFLNSLSLNLSYNDLDELKTKNREKYDYIVGAWPVFHTRENPNVDFLLLTSNTDMHLLQDAVDFSKLLQKHNHQVQYTHVPNTTHFSIRKHWNSTNSHVFIRVRDFLNAVMLKTHDEN